MPLCVNRGGNLRIGYERAIHHIDVTKCWKLDKKYNHQLKIMSINKSYLIKILIIVVVYFILAKLGLLMAFKQTNASPVWPPTGFAIAVILLWGYRVWPGIFIGAFLINVLTFAWHDIPSTTSVLMSLGIGTGNVLEAIVGAFFILRFAGTNDPFSRAHNVFKFVFFMATVATIISATIGVSCVCAGDVVAWSSFGYTWWTWWVGDAVGALVIAPVVLAWVKETPINWKYHQYLLACFVLTILLGVLYITYGISEQSTFVLLNRLEYLTIPIIVLSTFLFGRLGATNTVLINSVIAVLFTVNGQGPFVMEITNDSLLLLQTYVAVLAIVSLFLMGALSERKTAESKLKELNEELESRVIERTANLNESNEQLRIEIVEREKAEERTTGFANILEESLNEIYIFDDKTLLFIHVNKGARLNLGYSMEELSRLTPLALKPEFTVESFAKMVEPLRTGKQERTQFTTTHRRKDGSLYDVEVHLQLSIFQSVPVFVAIILDITDRKKMENELRESELRLREMAENITSVFWMEDSDGNLLYTSPAYEQIWGRTCQSFYENPKSWLDAIHPDDRQRVADSFSRWQFEGEYSEEFRIIRPDGEVRWIYDRGYPIRNKEGEVYRIAGIAEDITERKKMGQALIQSDKLKSIGTITAGISHEFNNILAIVSGKVQILKMRYAEEKELAEEFDIVLRAVKDGAEISNRMLAFTKTEKDDTGFETDDICDLINQSIDFTMPRWKSEAQAKGINYQMNTEGMKRVSSILCNPTEIREVFINIINNALDAMPGGGSLSVGSWCSENTVFIDISDTGEGMSEDVKNNIFDPFFTTKAPVGTGLGMSMVYGIVTRHGGRIEVRSEIGNGSTFTLQFPVTEKAVGPITAPEPNQKINKKNLRILVVDDEENICNILDIFLSEDGHKVKTVDNGADAINLIKAEHFDLVLCDLAMPNVSGYDVVEVLNSLDKSPKIGIITGWGDEFNPEMDEELKVDLVVRKPFDLLELVKHINDVIG